MLTRRLFFPLCAAPLFAGNQPCVSLDAEEALKRLLQGNERYASNHLEHPDQTAQRRMEVSKEQHPYAVILSCADSRVPPEIIFDEGLGDLFVIRNAGHVVDNAVLGSVEYAVEHLHVRLVMVLGHESCGAVKAAIEHVHEAHLTSIVRSIAPAVKQAQHEAGDLLGNSVRDNVKRAVSALSHARPILSSHMSHHDIRIVGATYSLADGRVRLL